MGPFEFADTIGIDNVLATLEVLSHEEGSQFLPCRLLKQMVVAGKLGKKTGRGFYTYG
jgi:3-hydroxybutyryl-CoA dehydrogenase